ncbi:antitoxin YezG family protein [Pseudoalteromonas sp. OFAV1]|jgi:hypothetical protein|uniref:immunity protein YezG family protein n=1 Tax=Pseudoalteromonas sp. OFAV1 TaxID=2908892 RepID=UPI001F180BDC|nr:immunity protein YezG family protein [Pseudoalteromonas sp. OFAV1]MCF2902728.1 antitoxin YezG family protein [Pseudoalteromonas sp. OFAV1]
MTIDDIYAKIAHNISNTIENDWAVASIDCELSEGAGRFKCVYKEDNDSVVDYDFDISFKTFEAFENLHKITTERGENNWNRAKFTLYRTGKFNVDFAWDQSLDDELREASTFY